MNYNRDIALYFEPNEKKRLGGFFNNNKHGTVIPFYALWSHTKDLIKIIALDVLFLEKCIASI